ncbi:venom allergen 5 [Sergentomyia squamirostris]
MWNTKGLCIVFGLMVVMVNAKTLNYCDPEMCPSYDKPQRQHIGCKNSDIFGPKCPSNVEIVPMTNQKKMLFLKLHNRLRDRFSRGKIPNFSQAAKMPILNWNDELAKLAEYNVRTCIFDHDECRATNACPFAGQNLGWVASWPNVVDENFVIKNITREWFYEYRFASQENTNNYTVGLVNGEQIGHFTALIHEKSDKVGCAVSRYSTLNKQKNEYLVACNYCYTNMKYERTYTPGIPCSQCNSGKCGQVYKGLCDESEKVEPIPDIWKKHLDG